MTFSKNVITQYCLYVCNILVGLFTFTIITIGIIKRNSIVVLVYHYKVDIIIAIFFINTDIIIFIVFIMIIFKIKDFFITTTFLLLVSY